MPDLLTSPLVKAPAVLDVLDPVDLTAPLNRDLHNWHLVLPHALGGVTWRNVVRPLHPLAEQKPGHVLLSGTEPRSAVVGWGATTRQGGWGELRLDGVAAGAIPSSALYDFVNAEFTVSCWVRVTVAAQVFVLARRTSAGLGGWFLRLDSGGTATARLMNPSAGTIVQRTSVTATLLTGAWVHLAAAFTTNNTLNASNEIALYVNGRLDQGARTGNTGLYNTPEQVDVTLGMYVGITPLLTGALDDVRMTRRLLTALEVQRLYQASRTGYRRELRWLSQPFFVALPGTARALTATLLVLSTTPDVSASLRRAMASAVSGLSSTPTSSASVLRRLQSLLAVTSATPVVAALQSRRLTSSPYGLSVTPEATGALQRRLASLLGSASVTPSASVSLARRLQATLAGTSTTAPVAAQMHRRLTSGLVASSTTPPVSASVAGQVYLSATLVVQSVTIPVAPRQARRLVSTLAVTSVTPAVLPSMGWGLRSTLLVSSTTPAGAATVLRALRSTVLAVSQTPPILLLPVPETDATALQRVEYPFEVHYVRPDGVTVRIVKKRPMPPAVRVSGRLLP